MRSLLLVVLLVAACEPVDDEDGDEPIAAGIVDDARDAGVDAGVNACLVFDTAVPQPRLGSLECERLDDGTRCPRACFEIRAARFDAEGCCQEPSSELIACLYPLVPFAGMLGCFVRSDGVAFISSGPIVEPFFAGFRPCSELERNVVMSTGPCP